LGAVGVAVGFAWTEVKLSPRYCAPIVVFTLAFLNLMFLGVRPRILAARAGGKPKDAALRLLVDLVRERPLIVLLVVLQLVGVSRSTTAAVTFLQVASGEHIRSLLNPSDLEFWMVVYWGVMTVVAGIWLASAVGIWCSRSWAWWLALVLNGLAASITGILQLLDRHSFLLDIGAITAVVLLLLPTVRNETGRMGRQAQRA
jgi:Na+/melibiose symporter-like transporter